MSNSLDQHELVELIGDLCNGTLDEPRGDHLEQLLRENARARDIYRRYIHLHASLRQYQGGYASEETQAKQSIPILGFLGNILQSGTNMLGNSLVLSLLFAIGLPGIILVVLLVHIGTQTTPQAPNRPIIATSASPVAQVIRTHECVWNQKGLSPTAGTKLLARQQLHLKEGLAEIRFADGANVLLEGPATLDVNTRSRGFLHVGNLVAKVPKGAEGFAIATPTAKIVDLGTEFGVSVAANGTAEAHVFKGEIEVSVSEPLDHGATLTKHFHAGEAVQVNLVAGNKMPRMVSKTPAIGKFVRHVPGTLAKPTIIFAHRGNRDPVTEGWKKYGKENVKTGVTAGPVVENGTAAWMFGGPSDKWIYYGIEKEEGLSQQLIDEARKKGWVLRARIWVSDQSDVRRGLHNKGLCRLSYGDGHQRWILHPTINHAGDQCAIICQDSSLGNDAEVSVPESRNRYVDYEIRYVPETDTANVYINGRLVATDFVNKRDETPGIHFGKRRGRSESRFSLVEWGILSDSPDTTEGVETPGRKQ